MSRTIPSRPAATSNLAAFPLPSREPHPIFHPPATDEEIGRLAGYRILKLLASGGMGMVFEAEDIALSRPVALKVIRPRLEESMPGSWDRFLREARAMAAIKHDHLVTVYQCGQDGDTVYLAMELLTGETLESRLTRDGTLPAEEVKRIGQELASGLAAIHERGLIHRDIKPANIWLEAPTGRVKILDFGLVRRIREENNITQTGLIVGTPAYLAPEQARGLALDGRVDLFALGCVLYRAATGQVPFPADTALAQLTALVTDDLTPVCERNPAIPPALAACIEQLLAKEREYRPATAADVTAILEGSRPVLPPTEVVSAAKLVRPGASKITRARKARKAAAKKAAARTRRRGLLVGFAGLALLIGIVVALALKSSKQSGASLPGNAGQNDPSLDGNADQVFLADLEKAETVNWPFFAPNGASKGGKFGPPAGKSHVPPDTVSPPVYQGESVEHGIRMHPVPSDYPPTSITYRIDKQFTQFSGAVAFNDTAFSQRPPLQFEITGDGTVLWRSQEITRQNPIEKFDVPVSGVEVLKLEVTTHLDPRGGHALWIDPVLSK